MMASLDSPEQPSRPRRRVLLGAFATSPYRGSEPGVGWNIAYHLAAHHDVTVLCFPGFGGDAVEAYDRFVSENGPVPGLTMHWVEQPWLSRMLQREGGLQRALYYHGYAAWQRAAYLEAKRLHAADAFDLVHHVNIIGFREPGYLWQLDLPFVWGPIAGAASIPKPFFSLLSPRDRLFYGIRNVLNQRNMARHRRVHRAAAAAKQIWAVDRANQQMVREHFKADAELMIETGSHPSLSTTPREFDGRRPLRILWSGVHEGRKCLPILLRAAAALKAQGRALHLTVLADGPETSRWKQEALRLGHKAGIDWAGTLPYEQAVARTQAADVFVLTSLQEGTPHVVLEALASGLPVICHDACGMATAVDSTCGIKVPMVDPATSVSGFAHALTSLFENPSLIRMMSEGAVRRASELSWERKAERIAEAYENILATV